MAGLGWGNLGTPTDPCSFVIFFTNKMGALISTKRVCILSIVRSFCTSSKNPNRVFSKCTRMTIMPILASQVLFRENKKIYLQYLQNATPLSIEPLNLQFQVQHASLYTNLAIACKTETFSSSYSHALLILTKPSKSKHQVVHEQKFKDLLSNTCQVSVERSMLDLEAEVQWFNTHSGNILLLEFFIFT